MPTIKLTHYAAIALDRWTIKQLINRTACYNPPAALERFIDSLPDEE